ncbi:MAG: thermonuclease family protein [Bacteroidota bacterium]
MYYFLINAWQMAYVAYVYDGDTLQLQLCCGTNSQSLTCRIAQVDAPERAQPFGQSATDSLKKLIEHQNVAIQLQGVDIYQRPLVAIKLSNGQRLDSLMIARGWAWHYTAYSHTPWLQTLQQNARQQKRGLWGCEQTTILEPALFRGLQRQVKKLSVQKEGCP